MRIRKTRGALTNESSRFNSEQHCAFDDGWGTLDEQDQERLPTTVTVDRTRTVVTRNDSPDVPFNLSVNPYRGCEHGCIYCFARPSHAYLGLSPGLDFETKLLAKPNAPELLSAHLRSPRYRCEPIVLGANTDPYQPVERRMTISRRVLEVFHRHKHPVSIITKSNLILRDLDILAAMADQNLATVFISVTTLQRDLARRMEPRAPTPTRRLHAVASLAQAGVPVGVLISPLLPGLTDHELEQILNKVAAAGAKSARYLLLRLPREVKQLFLEWLETHYPNRAKRVVQRIRDTRGGELYDPRFGHRMRGTGAYADLIAQRFAVSARRHGLHGPMPSLDCTQFVAVPNEAQLTLF